jgi:lipopolysaccharide transport system ATP-binding protein
MTDIAIKVENLGKAYLLGAKEERADTFVGAMMNIAKAPLRNYQRLRGLNTFGHNEESEDILWALKGVSFDIRHGEVVGIIGRNGAGKSTLLKILSRIVEPTEGRVEIRGRVSSLLEVGTGFHPELSGRENVYMNGTILGMKKGEIDRKFDEIVEFSGVERFLDTPVKRYSSGMKVRLAFAVAAHLEPEILIIDEVLAVGDAEFQKKCLGKMQDVAGGGRTVLFVSHNMGAIQNLCPRAVLLKHGLKVDEGPSEQVIRDYLQGLATKKESVLSLSNPDRKNCGFFRLTEAFLSTGNGQPTESIIAGENIAFNFRYESDRDLSELQFVFTVYDEVGTPITNIHTGLKNNALRSPSRNGLILCSIPKNPFAVGHYRVAVAVNSFGQTLDHVPGVIQFDVINSIFFGTSNVPQRKYCAVYVEHEWSQGVGA